MGLALGTLVISTGCVATAILQRQKADSTSVLVRDPISESSEKSVETLEEGWEENSNLHDGLIQRNNKREEVSVEAIKNGLVSRNNGYAFSQYGFHADGKLNKEQAQVQSLFDTKSCGPHCIRRIQQYTDRATNKNVIRKVLGMMPNPLSTFFRDLQAAGENFFEETKDLIL